MKKLLIKNIKGLAVAPEGQTGPIRGEQTKRIDLIENAFLAVENGKIADFGPMREMGGVNDWSDLEVIDATGKFVLPAFCDSHTHLVFAASRESEFVDRINGLTYEEIGKKGGGILNSARKLASMPEEELFNSAMKRLSEIRSWGTGAVEIKSGYGLSVESELKMLRVIRRLNEESDLTIKATFLGAHAFPAEFKENREGYVKCVVDEMIPAVAAERLADFIDVFCERNYFTNEQLDAILTAGVKAGLRPKIHVNQFSVMGGVQTGIKHRAVSVDHLEEMSEADFVSLEKSDTIATALPGCSFFLGIPYSPVRKMLERNIAVALATDFNPGSAPNGNMQFILSLACTQMKLTPSEAINAATINGAFAMELGAELGSIALGKKANLILTKEIPSLDYLPYAFAANCVERVILHK